MSKQQYYPKIERRSDGAGFQCLFHIGEQEYLGSLVIQSAYADFYGTECIIFKTTNGQFSFEDALGECMARNIEFSPEALRECVSDFIETKQRMLSTKQKTSYAVTFSVTAIVETDFLAGDKEVNLAEGNVLSDSEWNEIVGKAVDLVSDEEPLNASNLVSIERI